MRRVSVGNARGRASRAKLIDAAAVCFGERGFKATRIADIAGEAGMSQAGFYRHFGDKTELLLLVLREPLDALLTATGPLSESDDLDLETIVARNTDFFRVYAQNRRLLRVLRELGTMHEPGMEHVWLELRAEYVERIAKLLHRLHRAGKLETTNVDVLADALGGVLDQLAYTRLGLADAEPTDEDIETLGRVSGEVWAAALGL